MADARFPARMRHPRDENGGLSSRMWQNYFPMAAAAVANQTPTTFSFIGVTGLGEVVDPPADASNNSVPVPPAVVSPATAMDSGMQFAVVKNNSTTGAGIYVRFSNKISGGTAAAAAVGVAPVKTDIFIEAGGKYEHPCPFHTISIIGDNDASLPAYSVQAIAYW